MGSFSIVHIAMLLCALALYCLPSIIAFRRKHHNRLAILALDVLLGWTVLGWVGSLIWSLTAVEAISAASNNQPKRAKARTPLGLLLLAALLLMGGAWVFFTMQESAPPADRAAPDVAAPLSSSPNNSSSVPSSELAAAPAPKPFIPVHPIRARALPVFGPTPIPGAIVCDDHDTVSLMIDLYKVYFKEQIENQVIGDRMNLLRGKPSSTPDLAAYKCVLVQEGTVLDRINTLGPAVQVEWGDATGKRERGVTDYFMVEDSPVFENKKEDQSSSVGGTSVNALSETELPELANTPDLTCSPDHQGCTDAEFAKVLSYVKTQWSQMPQSLRDDCRSNSTALGMEDCILNKTLNWQQEHPGEKPTWMP